jgi:hypothetical protein
MTIKRETVGSGMTKTVRLTYDDPTDEANPEIAKALEFGTLDGMLASIERECFAIMQGADLPTFHGSYNYNRAGDWHVEGSHRWPEEGWSIANEIWPIAKARGIPEDSVVGFASRILGDVVWLRRARQDGRHDRVAQYAYYLGAKRARLLIKSEHETMWARGVDEKMSRARGGAATRKGSEAERLACYRRYRDQGLSKTYATDQAAKELGISPASVRAARKGAGASD